MPTLAAMRRRGYPAAAIREFIDTVGVAKSDSFVEVELLEHIVRDQLNLTAPRRMAVLEPLKVVLITIQPTRKKNSTSPISRRIPRTPLHARCLLGV
jgi:glutaminyl-tRNA synthetase